MSRTRATLVKPEPCQYLHDAIQDSKEQNPIGAPPSRQCVKRKEALLTCIFICYITAWYICTSIVEAPTDIVDIGLIATYKIHDVRRDMECFVYGQSRFLNPTHLVAQRR
ncbi:hypothetical protein H4I96_09221 [Botrytis cinerea]